MKITKKQLELALEELKNVAMDAHDDEIVEDAEDPFDFLSVCIEFIQDHKDDDKESVAG